MQSTRIYQLVFQDEIHGYLFEQVEKTMDLLLSKYMAAYIRYEGLNRVEEYAYPEFALREALLNAIAHKDYASGNPIQIKVYKDKIIFWNAGKLPDILTVDSLLKIHPSIPYNPDVAMTFFRAGLIEAWGRGTLMIIDECKKANLPTPVFSDDVSGFWIEFQTTPEKMSGKTSDKILILVEENKDITIAELSQEIGVTERTIERNMRKLQQEKRLERIGSRKEGHWKIVEE